MNLKKQTNPYEILSQKTNNAGINPRRIKHQNHSKKELFGVNRNDFNYSSYPYQLIHQREGFGKDRIRLSFYE